MKEGFLLFLFASAGISLPFYTATLFLTKQVTISLIVETWESCLDYFQI